MQFVFIAFACLFVARGKLTNDLPAEAFSHVDLVLFREVLVFVYVEIDDRGAVSKNLDDTLRREVEWFAGQLQGYEDTNRHVCLFLDRGRHLGRWAMGVAVCCCDPGGG